MNYTEEQYSELYNNLPKGLRDLVLTGALSTQIGALAMKYGLTPEEQSELEPAIEDVALGLITPEELAENIFIQVGLDDERAQAIAGDSMRDIYGEYLEELRLTRKYKIELDTRIRKEAGAKIGEEEEEVAVGGEKPKVAGNIISITKQDNSSNLANTPDDKDKKVADWFAGKKSVSSRAELDALGDDLPLMRTVPIQKTTPTPGIQNIPTTDTEMPVTRQTATTQPKSAWDKITTDTPNSLKPTSTPTPSVSRSENTVPGQTKDFDKSLVQVEQQIFTLTQAVNKMIEQNTKTISPVVQSVFSGGQFEEVSRRMDAMNHRIDDLQTKLLTLIEQHKKDVTGVLEKRIEETVAGQPKIAIVHDTAIDTPESAIDRIIKIKKESPITQKEEVVAPIATAPKPQTFTSTVSKNALDGIFQSKKEPAGNPIAITKTETVITPQPTTASTSTTVPQTTSRSSARDQLLKDLEVLKQGLQPKAEEVMQTPQPSTQPVASTIPTFANELKEEITPSTDTDKMKSLQEKIKSLNRGITQGGIVSTGNTATDPYRQ
jgi:hypothetical protein